MPAQKRSERLQIMLRDEELEALDNFRFRYRMPSRAAAVRHILMQGLAATDVAAAGSRDRSSDFGVIQSRSTNGRRKGTAGSA